MRSFRGPHDHLEHLYKALIRRNRRQDPEIDPKLIESVQVVENESEWNYVEVYQEEIDATDEQDDGPG